DAHCARVLDILRAAGAEGRLTPDELDERMAATLAARTLGELAALTADLPSGQMPPAWVPPVPPQPQADVFRLDQRGGSVQRNGRWVLPARLGLRPSWGDVPPDLNEAGL